jgi:hypothetical protein
MKILYNGGIRDIVLDNYSSSSSSDNRLQMSSDANYILNPNAKVDLLYDSTSRVWRVFGLMDNPTLMPTPTATSTRTPTPTPTKTPTPTPTRNRYNGGS